MLKDKSDKLPGARKYFMAHSLGNMLVSAARQDHELQYESICVGCAEVLRQVTVTKFQSRQISHSDAPRTKSSTASQTAARRLKCASRP